LGKLYDVLTKLGYKLSIPIKKSDFIDKKKLKQLETEKSMKVVSFYHPNDPFKIIDIGVNLPNIGLILRNKQYIEVDDLLIPAIFVDDLIKMKEKLARPKDLIDAQNLREISKYEKQKNKKAQMVDEHLLHVYKNTTPKQRLVWLKKTLIFAKR